MKNLKGRIAVVTGGSRGVGKGAALGLAESGAVVYVTGRTEYGENMPDFLRNTGIYKTADDIKMEGGICIPHKCDHNNDSEVELLFNRVLEEQGRLDILVNCAWGGSIHAMNSYYFNTPFWKQPIPMWDDHFNVGLRSNYTASRFAAEIMTVQKSGLIVNISYYGGSHYLNNVSYGVSKAAVDRLSSDTAYELKDYGVTVVSLYPGQVATEGMIELAKYDKSIKIKSMESPRYTGRCIARLSEDTNSILHTGRVLTTSELGKYYGISELGRLADLDILKD